MTTYSLLGVPLDLGAENLGVSMGADTLRYQQIVSKLQDVGMGIRDTGNIVCKNRDDVPLGNPRLKRLAEIVRVAELTADATKQAILDGHKNIVLGGDHSICLGAVTGASVALNGNLGIIYFDAHGDMNTDKTTRSGNIHGMQLASLLGYGAPELAHIQNDTVKIKKEHLLHIGGSDFDQAELDLIAKEKLTAFTMFDILTKGLGSLLPLIDDLVSKVDNIWISLDLDSIDALYAPGAGMPNKKGLTYREISLIATYIGKHCNVVGVDVVEYNPLLDEQGKTAELAIELIAAFYGKTYNWYSHYMTKNNL